MRKAAVHANAYFSRAIPNTGEREKTRVLGLVANDVDSKLRRGAAIT
jgi:hypothetical protein